MKIYTKKEVVYAINTKNEAVLNVFEADWIGQGYGYKLNKKWSDIKLDEVIYIPEAGYYTDNWDGTGYPLDTECVYTKQDFINLVKDLVMPSRVDDEASALFDMVDYQCPETLASELEYDAEYE